jgi:hypothetical protein
LQAARRLATEHNLVATDEQKRYFDKSATHHNYHEGQFVLMEDFNFLNKHRKLAPCFSGPFRILCVKGPHNVELLLTNGRKIIVNVAQVKPYFSSQSFNNDVNGFLYLETNKVTDDASAAPPSFHPPPLSLAHSRRPSRPRKMTVEVQPNGNAKVLSPTPTISFSKRGKDSPSAGTPPPSDKTVTVKARMHPMHTHGNCNNCAHCTYITIE